MFYFFNNLGKRRFIGLMVFVFLLIALPLIVIQVQKQQNTKQRAEGIEGRVRLELKATKEQTAYAIGEEFMYDLNIVNPARKDISAVDIVLNYDPLLLDIVYFSPESAFFSPIFIDTSKPGKVHYVAANPSSTHITFYTSIGILKLKAKSKGQGAIDISNILVTAQGESQALAINPADNIIGSYTVLSNEVPTVGPTDTSSSPTPTSLTISSACQAPKIISCGVDENSGTNPSWSSIDGVTKYRLEWCYKDAYFTESDFKNRLCGFITTPETNIDIIFPVKPSDYKIIVRSDSSNTCSTVGRWSDIKSCTTILPTPTPQPPFLSDIGIDPQSGSIGTKFTVFANVRSEDKIEVKANIKFEKAFAWIKSDQDSLILFDDGLHGDGDLNDGLYANVWDSNGKGLIKEITVEAKNTRGNLATLNNAFQIHKESCQEAVPGHNDKNASRVNLVFTGANYGSIESFTKDVAESIDFNGTEGGLLSQEPFRSNKDKFNFWYVDQIDTVNDCEVSSENIASAIGNKLRCRQVSNIRAKSCIVDKKEVVGLFNIQFRSYAPAGLIGGGAIVSSFYKNEVGSVVLHEFGHSFGNLGDEYIVKDKIVTKIPGLNKILARHFANIFEGTSQQCLSSANPWKDLIGYGCKIKNKIDCINNYIPDNSELECVSGADKQSCHIEAACYKGAFSANNYRSSFNSIMRDDNAFDKKNFSRGYGPTNEREMCKRLKQTTGSAGGICTTDYGIR